MNTSLEKESKPLVLFDIDYTIFDTEAFKKSNLAEYLLYPGVKDTLSALHDIADLGIISQGELSFQMNKLLATKIIDLFTKEYIFIIDDKKNELYSIMQDLKNRQCIFVEDKLEMLSHAKRIDSTLFTVWFCNGPFAQNTKELFIPDATIYSMHEVLEVVNRLPSEKSAELARGM